MKNTCRDLWTADFISVIRALFFAFFVLVGTIFGMAEEPFSFILAALLTIVGGCLLWLAHSIALKNAPPPDAPQTSVVIWRTLGSGFLSAAAGTTASAFMNREIQTGGNVVPVLLFVIAFLLVSILVVQRRLHRG
ncbi:hypothetical protein LSI54_02530 [Nesterenkonia sp. AY15]|uniref:hypothetical protein n=1 Tax=Nesterenkonia sp. AY15 TaxID=2901139 RepID=UPI001F4CD3D8|nr:hypothetical protein [Nesterenkonia sp. AY15]MCH8570246.1 hypothetical protein [Nesterenkonia sp. AY15]